MKLIATVLVTVAASLAQAPGESQPTALTEAQAVALYERALQLMESTGYAIPNLTQSAAPLTEVARQSVTGLKGLSSGNPAIHYRFLTNLRAYLLLADSVIKPNPFPDQARRQLAELRDALMASESYFETLVERVYRDARNSDRDNLARYQDANARTGSPVPNRARVVFMGDSITDFWRLNEYFPERDFVNRGISGQITGQMLGRFYSDVVSLRPAAVLILAGTNDIARGVSLLAIESNLAMMADLAVAHKIKPIFATLLPVSDYHKNANPLFERTKARPPEVIRTLNQWLNEYCRTRGFAFVNYYAALSDANGYLKAELAQDGLHPDPPGYRLMAPLALEAIEKNVTPVPQAQPQGKKRRLF